MKWYKPIQTIQEDIKEPIRQVAVIAITALIIAGLALFFALGKE
jgi:hypothetical protein